MSRPAFVVAPSAVDPEEARLLEIIVTGRRAAAELAEEPAPDRRKGLEAAVGAADEARRLIVQAHQGLVAKIARRYQRSGVPMADLMQEGNIGLLAALDRFDPEAGRFSSFAWYWVRQMMLAAIPPSPAGPPRPPGGPRAAARASPPETARHPAPVRAGRPPATADRRRADAGCHGQPGVPDRAGRPRAPAAVGSRPAGPAARGLMGIDHLATRCCQTRSQRGGWARPRPGRR